jgi:putative transposase
MRDALRPVSLEARRFEIPSRYRHLPRIHLRYARWDLAAVDLIDARHGTVLCAIYPIDKSANASGRRRALEVPWVLQAHPVTV